MNKPYPLAIGIMERYFADITITNNKEWSKPMLSLFFLIDQIISLYMWCLIIVVVMSWLTSFNIINTQNRFVYQIYDFMYRITEPALRPIRRWIPNFGGIDISPVILILLLVFIRNLIKEYGSQLV